MNHADKLTLKLFRHITGIILEDLSAIERDCDTEKEKFEAVSYLFASVSRDAGSIIQRRIPPNNSAETAPDDGIGLAMFSLPYDGVDGKTLTALVTSLSIQNFINGILIETWRGIQPGFPELFIYHVRSAVVKCFKTCERSILMDEEN